MILTNLLIFYIFIPTIFATDANQRLLDRIQIHNELNRELRNAICCKNNMRCCKKKPKPPNVEIRAVLVRCPNTACEGSVLSRRIKKPIYSPRERDIKQFQGFDEDEPLSQSSITNCRKKLLLTIKISGGGSKEQTLKNEYIVVDHVYDPFTRKNTRILTPYVIKLKQEPISQMYGLKFLHVVNSQAREEVYNKHDANYTGCDTTSNNPTCGKITYNGKIIPYSQGFCCSCDALKNTKRQPESLNEYAECLISYSDPAYLLDGIECPRNLKGRDNINQAEDLLTSKDEIIKSHNAKFENVFPKIIPMKKTNKFKTDVKKKASTKKPKLKNTNVNPSQQVWNDFSHPNIVKKGSKKGRNLTRSSKDNSLDDQSEKYFSILNDFIKNKNSNDLNEEIKNLEKLLRPKRQVQSSGSQRRGGQNCADRYTPKGKNPETYHESTHCLRFSDLWYTVYHLHPPMIENSVLIQLFEKHDDMNGHTIWKDITRGKMIRVGTIKNQYTDEKNTISIKYSSDLQKADQSSFSLNYKSALLMIPEGTKNSDLEKHPELQGGPGEFLIAHASQVSLDGDQCNVAGVGFEAFVRQPNRCSRPRGSCLTNQPYNLWKHDRDAEKLGKKGCFFLKHFGKLPENPIRQNPKTGDQYLVLEYDGSYSNIIDMELKADFNTVLRPQSSAQITEVYVDSTSPSKTILTVKITNSGLTSSSFIARLTDCPLEVPASFNNIQSKPALIPPQHQHVFKLVIKCCLPADRFHCSVEALNCKGELVSLRRVRLQKFDRCICTWHCLCACVGSSEGLKCIPMSLQHYHAAGFQGSLPVTSYVVHYTFFDDVISLLMYIFLFIILTLFTLGLCKALIGITCCPAVGAWGLDVILDLPQPMKKYHERELSGKKVFYDQEGYPIHPDTKQNVRSTSRSTEFCINIFFFFSYPFNITIMLLQKMLCLSETEKEGPMGCRCALDPTIYGKIAGDPPPDLYNTEMHSEFGNIHLNLKRSSGTTRRRKRTISSSDIPVLSTESSEEIQFPPRVELETSVLDEERETVESSVHDEDQETVETSVHDEDHETVETSIHEEDHETAETSIRDEEHETTVVEPEEETESGTDARPTIRTSAQMSQTEDNSEDNQ